MLNRDNKICGIYRLCRVLSDKTSTTGRIRKNRTSYEWEEISAGAQKLVFLGPTPGMELLKTTAKFDFGTPETCCLGHLGRLTSRTMTCQRIAKGEICH